MNTLPVHQRYSAHHIASPPSSSQLRWVNYSNRNTGRGNPELAFHSTIEDRRLYKRRRPASHHCNVCGATYTRWASLQSHMERHEQTRRGGREYKRDEEDAALALCVLAAGL